MADAPSNSVIPDTAKKAGFGFASFAAFSSIVDIIKGFASSLGRRLAGAATVVCLNGPRNAFRNGVWGAVLLSSDCIFSRILHTEECSVWSYPFAGATTEGLFQMRNGFRCAGVRALLVGAVYWVVAATGNAIESRTARKEKVFSATDTTSP